jgi:nucleoid-associated protein YgaU
MIKNRAGWLALSVLAIATVLMVFFVMPRLSKDEPPADQAPVAAGTATPAPTDTADATRPAGQPAAGQAAPGQAVPKTDSQTAAGSATLPSPATPGTAVAPATETARTALVVPTFDVLRVEPDGSAVIAGRAEPKAKLEVADQARTVAASQVDTAGEFVAILDVPLPPGDHQLVLKATSADGRTVMSEEIATVSVPMTKDGELLAMVTKPGTASRIIAMPTASAPAKTERVALGGKDAAAVAPQGRDAAKPGQLATPSATAPTATAPATGTPPTETATAPAAAATAGSAPQAAQAAVAPDLQVSAVEIEGDRIFIAGISRPGTKLRGYADGTAVGEAQAGTDGHFVIEGRQTLTVGQHRIAVDHIGPAGEVMLRVEVPFDRPAGEQVAAVATPQAGTAGLAPIDQGAFDRLRTDVSRAFQLLSNLYADGATPSAEQVAAARSATAIALRSLTEYRLPAGAEQNAGLIVEQTAKDAAAALAALEALPRDVAGLGAGLPSVREMIARTIGPILPNGAVAPLPETVAAAQAVGPAAGATTGQPAADGAATAPKTIAQAPLTQSEAASVIIRRGDTLWQISRRIYGQGVRYTTIYIANQDQINNPNLIEPGQIFGLPKDAMPNGEAEQMHRRLNKS